MIRTHLMAVSFFGFVLGVDGGLDCAGGALAAGKPNLVFILADDLGWRDTSLYGSAFYETPNIERLARRGMMFMQAYSANPLCSPTRASIQTGLYPGRIGITSPACHLPQEKLDASLAPGRPDQRALQQQSATRLKTSYFTLAEALHDAGYATGHFGKWHLGHEPYSPLQQGFDVDVPHWPGPGPAGSYVAPWKFPPKMDFTGKPGEHIEDRMAQEAIRFIEANQGRPFYLNYWAFSVHSPWDAKKELIEKYQAKVDPNSLQRCALYAAMVQSLDENLGRLLDTLDRLKLSESTIIILFSDNGGVMYHEIDGATVTSNWPLRGGKATLYEGGTREPCIVVWPDRVRPCSTSDALLSSVDFYPTILEMLGLKPHEGLKFDGLSQVPALLGQGAPRDTVYCFFPHYTPATGNVPGTWVRRGDWKLIRFHCDSDDQADRFELYNLKDDLGETKNLATQMPEKVKELDALISRHLEEIHALVPTKNPNYRPSAAGWSGSAQAEVSMSERALVIRSTGGDPSISTREVPAVAQPVTLAFRMKSNSRGKAQAYWTTQADKAFHRDRSVVFDAIHDGQWHEYRVELPVGATLTALRLDPSQAAGEMQIERLRLLGSSGQVLREWQFGR